ncbi:3-dehydroquinate synthase [Pelagicoccus sp. SDUM812003]|uniref:3-dehydroquinate synthase n=1 Tax=Pelagicoccus sp. SDUM812003 TaxID=3041267 RepID=UPI00280C4D54|nr:3-dehydroquinate synthase [Pelagicoccus sp. SDUM812003]MDQ8203291.1 3-dehydroquinate synthase [Pelagicoccus sp. SDUM812003]
MSSPRKVFVETAKSTYPIHVGRSLRSALLEHVAELKAKDSLVAAVTDSNVYAAQPEFFKAIEAVAAVKVVPAGETSKCLATFGKVLDFLAENKLDRGGVVLAIGGGVVGDLAGYAAASFLRGVRFIQIPTTLLAMVDSSVGGKTGINISAGKNLVGAFHQPIAVYSDIDLLKTMPPREFASGMAEIIKHGMLADAKLFQLLEARSILNARDERLEEVVEWNCRIKATVVNADEKETAASGGRALLNLGHTFGHAIENVAGYGEYLHGEAIGIGLVAAAMLSCSLGFIPESDIDRIRRVVSAHKLPTHLSKPLSVDRLMNAMRLDKKVKAGVIRFVVMRRIGQAETIESADMDQICRIWRDCGAV